MKLSWQPRLCLRSPRQGSPPNLLGGLSHSRVRAEEPAHASQSDQGPQRLQEPWTGARLGGTGGEGDGFVRNKLLRASTLPQQQHPNHTCDLISHMTPQLTGEQMSHTSQGQNRLGHVHGQRGTCMASEARAAFPRSVSRGHTRPWRRPAAPWELPPGQRAAAGQGCLWSSTPTPLCQSWSPEQDAPPAWGWGQLQLR